MEKDVKKSVAQRIRQNMERNAAKKLTKEQKAEKIMRKLKRDSAVECRVSVFRVEDLSIRSQRFKVDKNAQQLALHGLCLIPDKKSGLILPSLIIVEGMKYFNQMIFYFKYLSS